MKTPLMAFKPLSKLGVSSSPLHFTVNLVQQAGHPCGLVNLGSTCYGNAALQCIYSVPSIRNAFFNLSSELSADSVIFEIQQLFLAMSFGEQAHADTASLFRVLQINASKQQVSCHHTRCSA